MLFAGSTAGSPGRIAEVRTEVRILSYTKLRSIHSMGSPDEAP